MAMKKSQIYSTLWRSCDELRGGMDASQYKDYVLTLLFMKYVSDKYAGKPYAPIEVPAGASFDDMLKLRNDKEIGDKINKIIARLAEANNLRGAIDLADFNNEDKLGRGEEMVARLTKLLGIFAGLDFRSNRTAGDDLLGDAYEYLMRHFATESGKSKGQFYTPAEVSRIMAKLIGIGATTRREQTLYDPTCGSGSLLLRAADEAPGGVTIYGQEMDNATWALARMNMILHNQPGADIVLGNTLASPQLKNPNGGLRTFDFVVANPPFSSKAWTTGVDVANDPYHRFEYGVPPTKNGDYAFLLHALTSLKSTGHGAVIMPHGVLFRGNAEATIRQNLVRHGFIKGIIGLPANLFYGTGIPACIVVLDKEHASERQGIFFIDASKGFIKDGPKNRLREQDIHKIVDVFTRQLDETGYSRLVLRPEIERNGFNLNIPRYIDSSAPEDLHDLEAHLYGGIPNRDVDALSEFWESFPGLRDDLFEPSERSGYSRAKVGPEELRSRISSYPEFIQFAERAAKALHDWQACHKSELVRLNSTSQPKQLIHQLAEDLLTSFDGFPLLGKYDVYQILTEYWESTMQDDVYLIVADGWELAAKPRLIVDDREQKYKEAADLVVAKKKLKMDLLPPKLMISQYFAYQLAALAAVEINRANAEQSLAEYLEECDYEGGPLEEMRNSKGEPTKSEALRRLRAVRNQPDFENEQRAIERFLTLQAAEANLSLKVKLAQEELDSLVLEKYLEISPDDIKELVVLGKWYRAIEEFLELEVKQVTSRFTARIGTIEARYAQPLQSIEADVAALSSRFQHHLADLTTR